MNSLLKIVSFLTLNALGFFSPLLCYLIAFKTGAVDLTAEGFDLAAFQKLFLTGTMLAWLGCAVLSFVSFFIGGKLRLLFLWLPVIVPLAYGLSVLYSPSLLLSS